MRQGANSAVRFTTYATLKQLVQGTARPGQPLPSAITFGIGAIAGLVTVYTTMPLECVLSSFLFSFFFYSPLNQNHLMMSFRNSVVKTRMQSLDARAQYRNSFHCAYRIFTEEGLTRFWTGTTPRLARLVVSRLSLYPFSYPPKHFSCVHFPTVLLT
jgi:solute carrier family 25 (mitochondrial citrate transporter), member 1